MTSMTSDALVSAPSPSVSTASSGAAVRPLVLFVVAYALNISPHEAVHALVSYWLEFSSTLFQMWMNPDAASATPTQLAVIAFSGPLFSLLVGLTSLFLYRTQGKSRPVGLFLLMMGMVGVYSFLGPMAGAAFGGDFNIGLRFLGVSRTLEYATSMVGGLLLAGFMFLVGRELSWWAPVSYGRAKNVVCTTAAPWLLGTVLLILLYWPLPRFFVGSTISGSSFWIFGVIGAAWGYRRTRAAHIVPSITRIDLIAGGLAVTMVRLLAHGVRLAH